MGELLRAPFAAAAVRPTARTAEDPAPQPPHHHNQRQRRGWATEQERLWALIWAECPGVGWRRLQRLKHLFGSLAVAWQATDGQLSHALSGTTALQAAELERLAAYRHRLGPEPIGDPLTPADRQRLRRQRCLLLGDASLPESLEWLERPPLQLFWQGQGQLWPHLREGQAVAVVGTRRPSRHGEATARAVGAALAEAGWPVVSGLAEGIDAAAHRGCLEAQGRPVGVLGTPLERVYPRHHTALQAEVGRRGLLVSELAPGTPVRAGHFAQRNRLQVALAQAVVLVECPQRSGALQSAQLAWDAGLPLWVVPGDASKLSCGGSNRWLAQGASVLLDPAQLIDSIGAGPLASGQGGASGGACPEQGAGLVQREAALLAALGAGACLDHLCERLRQRPAQLSERLLRLELAGLVRGEPGLWWRPSNPGL